MECGWMTHPPEMGKAPMWGLFLLLVYGAVTVAVRAVLPVFPVFLAPLPIVAAPGSAAWVRRPSALAVTSRAGLGVLPHDLPSALAMSARVFSMASRMAPYSTQSLQGGDRWHEQFLSG